MVTYTKWLRAQAVYSKLYFEYCFLFAFVAVYFGFLNVCNCQGVYFVYVYSFLNRGFMFTHAYFSLVPFVVHTCLVALPCIFFSNAILKKNYLLFPIFATLLS